MPRTFFDLNLLANMVAKLGKIVGEMSNLTFSRTMLASLAIPLEFLNIGVVI